MEDLSYFPKEDLFPRDSSRDPNERVAAQHKPVYSISPVEYLIRLEELGTLRERGVQLQDMCREQLTLTEYGFLIEMVGNDFGRRTRMPFEFKHFTRGEFAEHFEANLEKFKYKIKVLKENVDGNGWYGRKAGARRAVNALFAFATEEKIIETYESVRNGECSFPEGFFDPRNKRLARVLTRYLIDNILEMPHNKVLPDINEDIFENNHLGLLLHSFYEGSPVMAIHDTYPQDKYPDIYNPDYKPDNLIETVLEGMEVY